MNDTSPEITKKMHEMIQAKSPIERFKMGCSMYDTSRYLVIRGILENNPNISEIDLRKELFLKFYRDDFDSAEIQKIFKHLEKCAIDPSMRKQILEIANHLAHSSSNEFSH